MPRFELLEVVNSGRKVAVIFDRKANRRHKVHRRGSRFYHWDRQDEPVTIPGLRRAAKEALA